MKSAARWGVLLGVSGWLAPGCGPGKASDSSNSSSSTTTTTQTDGTDDTGSPQDCPEGRSRCGEECVNLQTNREHCGSCDHECNEEDASGHCDAGRCTAVYSGCINETDGFATCREFCSSIGEKCGGETELPGHACYGALPWFEGSDCQSSQHPYFADEEQPWEICDWEIPFNEMIVFESVLLSVRCCCTQHGGE